MSDVREKAQQILDTAESALADLGALVDGETGKERTLREIQFPAGMATHERGQDQLKAAANIVRNHLVSIKADPKAEVPNLARIREHVDDLRRDLSKLDDFGRRIREAREETKETIEAERKAAEAAESERLKSKQMLTERSEELRQTIVDPRMKKLAEELNGGELSHEYGEGIFVTSFLVATRSTRYTFRVGIRVVQGDVIALYTDVCETQTRSSLFVVQAPPSCNVTIGEAEEALEGMLIACMRKFEEVTG